uniref:Uncharacterized protein n=1 Tax=Anguilla anguilla TaxID=7936 RepID=A0A0E9S6X5_ANGAN
MLYPMYSVRVDLMLDILLCRNTMTVNVLCGFLSILFINFKG